jgi:hypothetical protein
MSLSEEAANLNFKRNGNGLQPDSYIETRVCEIAKHLVVYRPKCGQQLPLSQTFGQSINSKKVRRFSNCSQMVIAN